MTARDTRQAGGGAKHTPGPWVVARGEELRGQTVIRAAQGAVARLVRQGLASDDANACLIAAAPKMLGTLRGIVERHNKRAAEDNPCPPGESGEFTCGCADCQDARAAIAATGEAP